MLLVVDDEPLTCSAMHRSLKDSDCDIVVAHDGREAMAVLHDSPHRSLRNDGRSP
jgi:CheY-like chemotaxis protein